ncbi:hypothetical protein ACFW0H_27070 [Pseudomonas sp. CR3202]|uniref:hypothetical protein n=1 Tax=Pseudomonas sp. CR3202 TaxID=3351532 RepID=UPI003BF0642A
MAQRLAAKLRSSTDAANSVKGFLNGRLDPGNPPRIAGVTERSLRRQTMTQQFVLTSEQSAKVWRFAEILSKAEDVLGSTPQPRQLKFYECAASEFSKN